MIKKISQTFIRYFVILSISVLMAVPFGVHSETLDDAWRIAMENDFRLKAQRKTTEAAAKSLEAARSARFPNLKIKTGYTVFDNQSYMVVHGKELPVDVLGAKVPVTEDKNFSCQAYVSLPLYAGGMITSGIGAAQSGLKAATADEEVAVQNLKMMVAEKYIAVLRSMRAVEVAKSRVESLTAHSMDVKNLHTQGFVATNDLLAARVSLADACQQELIAANKLDITRAAYNRLLGRCLAMEVDIANLNPEIPEVDINFLTEKALRNRAELKGFLQRVDALKKQAAIERAASMPQLGIMGGYVFNENRYQAHEGVWSAMLGLNWNLFDGGAAKNKSSVFELKAEALLREYINMKSIIALQIRQAWLNIRESRERVKVAEKALAQSKENLRVAKNRYREGLSTNTVVLNAESLRVTSNNNYFNAIYDLVMATLRLRRAEGDL